MKPKRCPLAEWELEESEDKRTIQPDKGKCFFPAVVIRNGCPDHIYTPGIFKCPETHIDGGEYTNCDLFSRWWWYQKLHPIKSKKQKLEKEIKEDKIFSFPISDGSLPLTDSGVKDKKSTVTNWSKFKLNNRWV